VSGHGHYDNDSVRGGKIDLVRCGRGVATKKRKKSGESLRVKRAPLLQQPP
jgi:hypothetical protein